MVHLNGSADFANDIAQCPTRYVLSDELTTLCTALAYSKGTRTLECADLLHMPAEQVWIEWCEAPCRNELERYGFKTPLEHVGIVGRRGALIRASRDGRRGSIRTFWTVGGSELDVLASSVEAYFDFDTPDGEEPSAPHGDDRVAICVADTSNDGADLLQRCFRFRYERSWANYYEQAALSVEQREAITVHALGTIAIDVPVILTFCLLLVTRPGLPRRPLMLERLNRSRVKNGKRPLLDHIEVLAPVIPQYRNSSNSLETSARRSPRLHHVRGHLVRRASQLFWRVPHLRGSARAGTVRSRTVTWTIDRPCAALPVEKSLGSQAGNIPNG